MRYLIIALMSVGLTTVAGCGQKGDLYLPAQEAAVSSSAVQTGAEPAGAAPTPTEPDRPTSAREGVDEGPVERDPVNVDRPPM